MAALLLLSAWALTLLARRWNRRDWAIGSYVGLSAAAVLSVGGGGALLAGPWSRGLDPTDHVYPAIVWTLVIWSAIQVAVGLIMQLYCIARRVAGRMTARYDIDISNVTLYWHFTALTVVITVAVIAGFPLVA
jgi:cytochrome c oxidase subunit I+III